MPIRNPLGIDVYGLDQQFRVSNTELYGDPQANALQDLVYQEQQHQAKARQSLEAENARVEDEKQARIAAVELQASDILKAAAPAFERRRAAALALVAQVDEFLKANDDVQSAERPAMDVLQSIYMHLDPSSLQQGLRAVHAAAGVPGRRDLGLFALRTRAERITGNIANQIMAGDLS